MIKLKLLKKMMEIALEMSDVSNDNAYHHAHDVRVYYANTDAGGIVYHAEYLCFAEQARTEMLRHYGFEHVKLKEETGVFFVVKTIDINYKKPAKLDDLLQVRTKITSLKGTRMEMMQSVYKDDIKLTEISLILVCVNELGRPVPLPSEIYHVFEKAGEFRA